ncbi:FG-GAP-like repeat-containing protein [Allorhodopirellula solitaria]|nr:FG-GAP-like repeat-containing protein [Allorhodopirellula solitaria]
MAKAVDAGEMQRAWDYSDAVAKKHADDVETLVNLAKLAHIVEKPSRAADFLIQACRAETFHDPHRVEQAMVALVSAGRLFDGLDFLEEAVRANPKDYASQRTLYDLYVGTENRTASLPHGRRLVQQRQFDLELLKSLGGNARRSLDPEPLKEVLSRNPDDRRPMIGTARIDFDAGDYDKSIELLKEIVQSHPTDVPAHALLARAFSSSGQFDELRRSSETRVPGLDEEADYWLAIGDWARSQKGPAETARAYWEAARADNDATEAWTKLSAAMRLLEQSGSQLPPHAITAVAERAAMLSKFDQLRNRFERTGEVSREIATDIAEVLLGLGRLWEAEAWAAVATTLPEDDAVDVGAVRQEIVSQLRPGTRWQMTENHPELSVDLSYLPLPAIGANGPSNQQRELHTANGDREKGEDMFLVNEASLRNLNFTGSTADDLDVPGIMLHETLGCGGGTLDFDLDGWSDVYLTTAGGTPPRKDSPPNALFRNIDGTFENVTVDSGTGDPGFGQGVAVGDVNQDGFPDLLVLNYGANSLWVNQGDGTFADASSQLPATMKSATWSTSGAIADLDNDGLSDIVVLNYCAGLEPAIQTCPMADSDVFRSCSPMKFPAQQDNFYQMQVDGAVVDSTESWAAEPSVPGRGLGIVVGALDENAGADVLIANDMTENHYWQRVDDEKTFSLNECAIAVGLAGDDRSIAQGSMGIATGDLDRDGDIDCYVTNFDREYNTLYEQRSPGQWQDRTAAYNLVRSTVPLVGFGTEAIDLDNDGQLELILANGHVDMFSRQGEKSIYAHPMQIFRLGESGRFESCEVGGEYLAMPHVGRALWSIDANRDHQTDIAVTHQTEPVALLINRTKQAGSWIELQLVGTRSARDAIGAVVEVSCGAKRWHSTLTAGDGYLCSNERLLRIGLGHASDPCDITVTWPNQTQQSWPKTAIDTSWLLVEGEPLAFRRH